MARWVATAPTATVVPQLDQQAPVQGQSWWPAVLLWDEATSALDGQSEAKIHEALQHAKTGGGGELESGGTKPTAVVVAHRLSTALVADRVAVLREGRIEQIGTPQELAQQPGWFRENFYGGQAQQQ